MMQQRMVTVLCIPVFCLAVWALSPSAHAADDEVVILNEVGEVVSLDEAYAAIPADGLIVNGLLALWPSIVLYDRSARHPIAYDSSCMRA